MAPFLAATDIQINRRHPIHGGGFIRFTTANAHDGASSRVDYIIAPVRGVVDAVSTASRRFPLQAEKLRD
jgi:hypothetical protein